MKKILFLACICYSQIAQAQNVGIGTAYPTEKLQVDSGAIKIGNDIWDSTSNNTLYLGDNNFVTIKENNGDDRLEIRAKDFVFLPSFTNYSGNVGIGTTLAPSAKLEVNGQIKITGGTPGTNKILTSDVNGLATWQDPTINPWTTTSTHIANNNTGNVGIGTTATPAQKLEVAGAVKIGTTATAAKGTIRYNTTDSSFEAYDNTSWKGVVNNFSVKGKYNNGSASYFTSMVRNAFVILPALTDTIKKTGNYLIILTAKGEGVDEYNALYDPNDNRSDYEGELRVCPPGSLGNSSYFNKQFFYTKYSNPSNTTVTFEYHGDDGDKSAIVYLTQGDIIKTYGYVTQLIGNTAPPQVSGWYVRAQVKFILLN